jgi:hypothetical protein
MIDNQYEATGINTPCTHKQEAKSKSEQTAKRRVTDIAETPRTVHCGRCVNSTGRCKHPSACTDEVLHAEFHDERAAASAEAANGSCAPLELRGRRRLDARTTKLRSTCREVLSSGCVGMLQHAGEAAAVVECVTATPGLRTHAALPAAHRPQIMDIAGPIRLRRHADPPASAARASDPMC